MLMQISSVAYRRCLRVAVSRHRGGAKGARMNLSWIVLGLVGWAFGLLFVLALMRMSGNQDRAARHQQKHIDPYCDVTITRSSI
jgi:hypothetical protein